MEQETYQNSRMKMRRRRLSVVLEAVPGVLMILWFVGLYFHNALAARLGDLLVVHWRMAISVSLITAAFGVFMKLKPRDVTTLAMTRIGEAGTNSKTLEL